MMDCRVSQHHYLFIKSMRIQTLEVWNWYQTNTTLNLIGLLVEFANTAHIDFHFYHHLENQGRIQEFWLGVGVKVAVSTNRQNLFFKLIFFLDLITFRCTKPRYFNCSYSNVSKKWSAIFVQCIVVEIYFCFWRSSEPSLTSVLF